ncbi:4-hydroxy-tetrahydrodipicolinate reductase [candidate division TA06 bacterium]|nr:4-hydroxy-tetrahydrodipicolinate reductase [candidate division TA06 bacterium]
MIRVIVCGACGKMGSVVLKMISEQGDMKVVAGIESPDHQKVGEELSGILGLGMKDVPLAFDLADEVAGADCIVDFTSPEGSLRHLRIAAKAEKPMVIGTTGFSGKQMKEIEDWTTSIPCVLSPNMSIGVNLLFKIVQETAKILGTDYDVEIVEAHHRQKKDAPSGTAKRLGELIAMSRNQQLKDVGVYGRQGNMEERSKGEIGIHSIRAGDIVGDHTVLFSGPGERIELTHQAHSRDTFAIGTVRTIRFVCNAQPGLYDMRDVLGLR